MTDDPTDDLRPTVIAPEREFWELGEMAWWQAESDAGGDFADQRRWTKDHALQLLAQREEAYKGLSKTMLMVLRHAGHRMDGRRDFYDAAGKGTGPTCRALWKRKMLSTSADLTVVDIRRVDEWYRTELGREMARLDARRRARG